MTVSLIPGSRIAVVGACGGIGRAVVDAIRAAGGDVVALDTVAVLDGVGIAIDVRDERSVAGAFETVGAIDGLVNLAGYTAPRQAVEAIDPAVWDDVVAVNLSGAFRVARAALPSLRAGRGASLVHVASGLAARVMPGYGPYAAAKAGLIALTKTIALENAPLVRANVVAPGAVDTAFLSGGTGRARGEAPGLDREAYVRGVPMGRIGEPDDVVGPILFLLSAASGYMTGQVLWVNGGSYLP